MNAAMQITRVVLMSLLATVFSLGTAGLLAQSTNASDPAYTPNELEALVGRVALYPDDLLAIVLPASTYPIQVVQAARFLEDFKENSNLQSDETWDDSIVALLNYPEVVELMNSDLDWTWMLGEAVINQQPDVLDAIQSFRRRAWSVGNLNSDERQLVSTNNETIEITPVEKEVIYIPYYQPERVIVYQPAPVYHYYPRAYPLYYYPYPAFYSFSSGYFWGITTAYTFGWPSHRLNVYQPHFRGHPYYGQLYPHNYTVRRHNDQRRVAFSSGRSGLDTQRHQRGNQWQPGLRHGVRPTRGSTVDRRHRARLTKGGTQSNSPVRTRQQRTTTQRNDRVAGRLRNPDVRNTSDRSTARRQNAQLRQSFTPSANRSGSNEHPERRTRMAKQIQIEARGRPQDNNGARRQAQTNHAPRENVSGDRRPNTVSGRAKPPVTTSHRSRPSTRSGAASPPSVSRSKPARSSQRHDRTSSGTSSRHRGAKGRSRAR